MNFRFNRLRFFFFLAASVCPFPSIVAACPRCFETTPYKSGLLWATGFMLLITPILVASVFAWIVCQTRAESVDPSSAETRG